MAFRWRWTEAWYAAFSEYGATASAFPDVTAGGLCDCALCARPENPGAAPDGRFYSVTRTDEECSVVCEESLLAAGARAERGRSLLRVDGTLDFSLTGVLAALAAPLAQAKISIFALSTYDTDYLLLAQNDLDRAIAALERAGHSVKRSLNR